MSDQPPTSLEPTPPTGVTSESRLMAGLSYASMFTGFPLFLIPLLQKNDDFAMFHARQAAEAYVVAVVLFFAINIIGVVTCGFGYLLFPLLFFPWLPAIHGVVLVLNDERKAPMGTFGLADKMLGGS